jgi:multiple sugar transport system substrate-binding protein
VLAGIVLWLARLRAAGSRLFVLLIVLLAGCSQRPEASTATNISPNTTRPSVALRVLVVNDPSLATAINRLRGEWSEREGGTLVAESKPWAEATSTDAISADVIVFPARYLGELAGRLRPVRDSVISSKLHNAEDLLPLAREKLAVYGGRRFALPLGIQLPLFGYRDEWLVPDDAGPPSSWQEYHELQSHVGEAPVVWPPRDSSDHWPAIMLLARAASYACHPRQESPLFDPQSMAPRIAGPPFVTALDEWRKERAVAETSANNERNSAVPDLPSDAILHWAELPGANRVFNPSTGDWEPVPNAPRRVSLLAGGTLVAVTSTSRNATSAFGLAAWLTSSEIIPQLVPAGAVLLPCRRSNLELANRWIQSSTGAGAEAKVARVVDGALSREDFLMVPRIPGADEYLRELATAVDMALRGEQSPARALESAATQWNKITDRLGRDSQRHAYLNHLGQAAP